MALSSDAVVASLLLEDLIGTSGLNHLAPPKGRPSSAENVQRRYLRRKSRYGPKRAIAAT